MPYGTPSSDPDFGSYRISVQHDNGTMADITKQTGLSWGEADQDEAMQALLDLVAASPDFTVTLAVKSYQTTEEITPTP